MIHQEEVASVLAVIDVLEMEVLRLGTRTSRVADMWKDWIGILRDEPAPFQHPWEMPPMVPVAIRFSERAASVE